MDPPSLENRILQWASSELPGVAPPSTDDLSGLVAGPAAHELWEHLTTRVMSRLNASRARALLGETSLPLPIPSELAATHTAVAAAEDELARLRAELTAGDRRRGSADAAFGGSHGDGSITMDEARRAAEEALQRTRRDVGKDALAALQLLEEAATTEGGSGSDDYGEAVRQVASEAAQTLLEAAHGGGEESCARAAEASARDVSNAVRRVGGADGIGSVSEVAEALCEAARVARDDAREAGARAVNEGDGEDGSETDVMRVARNAVLCGAGQYEEVVRECARMEEVLCKAVHKIRAEAGAPREAGARVAGAQLCGERAALAFASEVAESERTGVGAGTSGRSTEVRRGARRAQRIDVAVRALWEGNMRMGKAVAEAREKSGYARDTLGGAVRDAIVRVDKIWGARVGVGVGVSMEDETGKEEGNVATGGTRAMAERLVEGEREARAERWQGEMDRSLRGVEATSDVVCEMRDEVGGAQLVGRVMGIGRGARSCAKGDGVFALEELRNAHMPPGAPVAERLWPPT